MILTVAMCSYDRDGSGGVGSSVRLFGGEPAEGSQRRQSYWDADGQEERDIDGKPGHKGERESGDKGVQYD